MVSPESAETSLEKSPVRHPPDNNVIPRLDRGTQQWFKALRATINNPRLKLDTAVKPRYDTIEGTGKTVNMNQ